MKHIAYALAGVALVAGMAVPGAAVEIDSAHTYCFAAEEFSAADASLSGVFLTRVPEKEQGLLMLGERVLGAGDVLTARQLSEMTFAAGDTREDITGTISYLPVFANGLAGESTMTLSIRGRENKVPVAQDCAFETYKNLELSQALKVHDPEGSPMQFTLTRLPRRGTVVIAQDGSFTYTPKKNRVGVDSFTYTAADEAGGTSREATVTIHILKPEDEAQYSDTAGSSCRFAAEWMKNTGIFEGENVGGSPCFSPNRDVTRGEFVTMLVKSLKIPTDENVTETGYENIPRWLQPYLAAAVRSGLTAGLEDAQTFSPDAPVSAREAAAMLCIALELEGDTLPASATQESSSWNALDVAAQYGFCLPQGALTRSDAACILYQASRFGQTDHSMI